MDQGKKVSEDLVHLARLALSGRAQDVSVFLHRAAKRYRQSQPDLAGSIDSLLKEAPTRTSRLRRQAAAPIPVDLDSRLQLVRLEHVHELPIQPVFVNAVHEQLRQLVQERQMPERLREVSLSPTRTAIFVGPPGVGKTLAARWVALQLRKPLLILDLSAVMSSFLGRTGGNLRQVLDYAKTEECILFIDEIDAVAKRRDDSTEIGELKRLVTVLLQEVDDWPETGLLLAATNHPDLLDPAVWRRFEVVVNFPIPGEAHTREAVERFLGPSALLVSDWIPVLATALRNLSFSDIERRVSSARRAAAVFDTTTLPQHLTKLVRDRSDELPKEARSEIAKLLLERGLASQRQAYELTGISRDTLRKLVKEEKVPIVQETRLHG